MPRLNHLAYMRETKTLKSVPVVEDGAKREGVVL